VRPLATTGFGKYETNPNSLFEDVEVSKMVGDQNRFAHHVTMQMVIPEKKRNEAKPEIIQ
jgi:hypothetical protein